MFGGAADASRESLRAAISNGDAIGVVVDGIAGMWDRQNADDSTVVVRARYRRGLAKLSLATGVPVLPTYGFGNEEGFSFMSPPGAQTISRICRMSFGVPYGRWGLCVPRRTPMMFVVG